jgi:hypothetical protein
MASDRKIEANRRNAQKSTGPTSTDGKSRSRFNALRHGMRSKLLVLLPDPEERLSSQSARASEAGNRAIEPNRSAEINTRNRANEPNDLNNPIEQKCANEPNTVAELKTWNCANEPNGSADVMGLNRANEPNRSARTVVDESANEPNARTESTDRNRANEPNTVAEATNQNRANEPIAFAKATAQDRANKPTALTDFQEECRLASKVDAQTQRGRSGKQLKGGHHGRKGLTANAKSGKGERELNRYLPSGNLLNWKRNEPRMEHG